MRRLTRIRLAAARNTSSSNGLRLRSASSPTLASCSKCSPAHTSARHRLNQPHIAPSVCRALAAAFVGGCAIHVGRAAAICNGAPPARLVSRSTAKLASEGVLFDKPRPAWFLICRLMYRCLGEAAPAPTRLSTQKQGVRPSCGGGCSERSSPSRPSNEPRTSKVDDGCAWCQRAAIRRWL